LNVRVEELVTHRMLDLGEVRLHVAEAGEGPLIVLLHGFPEFWYSWRNQIPALAAAGYRVVAPDLRGYGLSDKPSGTSAYRGEALVGDVRRLIAAYGQERAVVVGHDWGGIVAWLTALGAPQVVDRLVILNAPHPARFAEALRTPGQWLRSSYIAFFQLPVLPELLLGTGRGALVRRSLRSMAVRRTAFSDSDLAAYADAFPDPGALRAPLDYYRWFGRGLVSRKGAKGGARPARTVAAPTLILWGALDPVLPTQLADPGAALVPDRRVEIIQGAGHFVQADAPDRVNEAILRFLREDDRR
jgi:pimeloyl-ACP methyl ester carboxylesterase